MTFVAKAAQAMSPRFAIDPIYLFYGSIFEEEIRKLEAYEREEYIDFTNRLNRNKIKKIVIKIFLFFFPILSVKLGWKS